MESMIDGKTVYRNARFIKRNYETSNIVACVANSKPEDGMEWYQADVGILDKLTKLYIQNNVAYYGHL